MNNALTTKIRMYRLHELGDCFLLSFKDNTDESHVLIDCGSFRNSNASSKKFKEITKDIRKIVGPKGIDLVVATHQHNDHMSGFQHARNDFGNIGIQQVFLSWLDDENDSLWRKTDAGGIEHSTFDYKKGDGDPRPANKIGPRNYFENFKYFKP